MKSYNKELVTLLAKHLGSDEDAVLSQFEKLISDIQKAMKKGESFSIQGFGTFTSIDNHITFEVSPAFAAELNYSYEGMLPIDVDGITMTSIDNEPQTQKKPIIKKPVVIVDEDLEGEEDPIELPDHKTEEEVQFFDHSEVKSEFEEEKEEPQDVESTPFLISEDVSSVNDNQMTTKLSSAGPNDKEDEIISPTSDSEVRPDSILHDSNDAKDNILSDGKDPVQDEMNPRIISVEEDQKDYSNSSSLVVRWVALLVVLILIAGGAYWFFTGPGENLFDSSEQVLAQTTLSAPTLNNTVEEHSASDSLLDSTLTSEADLISTISPIQNSSEVPQSSVIDDQQSQLEEIAKAVSQVDSEITEPIVQAESQAQVEEASTTSSAPSFGLTGSVQDISGRVYSIIVHSLPSTLSAQQQCNEISPLNLRCLVREVTGPQGRTTYRVGIGQFESTAAAEAAILELPEPYRSRNFIARVN